MYLSHKAVEKICGRCETVVPVVSPQIVFDEVNEGYWVRYGNRYDPTFTAVEFQLTEKQKEEARKRIVRLSENA